MERLNAVLPYIKQRKCALFLGAGFSKIAGCNDWDTVVSEMLNQLEFQDGAIKAKDLLGKMGNETLMNYCFNIFEQTGDVKIYWRIARGIITPDPMKYNEEYLPLIKLLKLMDPFPQIITTNIDNCLENSREFNFDDVYFKPDQFVESNLDNSGVFHIHGYIENFENSLLTKKQYIKMYQEPATKDFLKSFFTKYSVIFLGYSLRDEELKNILFETKTPGKNHFLLVPEEDKLTLSEMSVYKEMFGIISIVYGKREIFPIVWEDWITKNFKPVTLSGESSGVPNV